jgi:hypothetical protein
MALLFRQQLLHLRLVSRAVGGSKTLVRKACHAVTINNGFSKLEFVPETRVAMALSEKYKVALEEYDDFGSVSHFLPAAKQSHQLFAVVDINTKAVAIEAGVGGGLTSSSDHWVLKLILSRDF